MSLLPGARIATTLVELGWSSETPAAIVVDASMANQHVWRGTLAQLAEKGAVPLFTFCENRGTAPFSGTIIVGDVVALAPVSEAAIPERKYVTGT